MTRRFSRILPPSFEGLDYHGGGRGFFNDPDKGPTHTLNYALGAYGLDESSDITLDEESYDPLGDHRDIMQANVRLRGSVLARPDTSETILIQASGIYDSPPYKVSGEELPKGHTSLACELIIPVDRWDRVRGDMGESVVRLLCKVVYSGAMELGYNERCACSDTGTCLAKGNHNANYQTSLGSLGIGLGATSHHRSVAEMSEALPELVRNAKLDLSEALDIES